MHGAIGISPETMDGLAIVKRAERGDSLRRGNLMDGTGGMTETIAMTEITVVEEKRITTITNGNLTEETVVTGAGAEVRGEIGIGGMTETENAIGIGDDSPFCTVIHPALHVMMMPSSSPARPGIPCR